MTLSWDGENGALHVKWHKTVVILRSYSSFLLKPRSDFLHLNAWDSSGLTSIVNSLECGFGFERSLKITHGSWILLGTFKLLIQIVSKWEQPLSTVSLVILQIQRPVLCKSYDFVWVDLDWSPISLRPHDFLLQISEGVGWRCVLWLIFDEGGVFLTL